MLDLILITLSSLLSGLRGQAALQAENIALRHQVTVLQRTHTKRPILKPGDRCLWVWLSRLWSGWRSVLIIVMPETVIGWHRQGFRWYWTWKVRHGKAGRPPVPKQIRDLIRTMSRENPIWGAPRIHSELMKLDIKISEASIAKYMVRSPKPPSQTWRTFLKNHVSQLASVDFFTVHSVWFEVLFVFIVLAHDRRRRIVHFQCYDSPNGRMDGAASTPSLPVRYGSSIFVARSRSNVWPGVPQSSRSNEYQRSSQRSAVSLATRLRRTCHRFDSP